MAGRNVPELPVFTFSNGRVARIRQVSPMLAQEVLKTWRKRNPIPPPPVQSVKVMGVEKAEPNYADPSYARQLAQYQERMAEEVGLLTLRLMVFRGVELDVPPEDIKAEVDELRTTMQIVDPDLTLEGDDKYVYVTMICATSQDDMNRLRDAIMVTSQPTPEEVQANITTFPGNVQG